MKILVRNIAIAAFTLITFNHVSAQNAGYITNGGMTIGFGLGGSYQGSDIANSQGFGFDFSLGHQLYRKENAFLALDWKFRFLAGDNRAYDHRENGDGTFSNIRYNFYNYDLELGLTLNRLRERTRIVLSGFVGAGITHGRTFADLLDSNNNPYDFSVIDAGGTSADIEADLMSLSDKDFETPLSNKGAIMPTAGIYLGYQLTRSFSMGFEYKSNFSLSERNGGFGIDIDNKIVTGSPIDMNHYASLRFKWSLGGRRSHSSGTSVSTGYQNMEISPVIHKDVVTEIPEREKPGLVVKLDSIRQQVGAVTSTVNTITSAVNTITNSVNTTNPVTSTGSTTRPGNTTTTKPVTSTRPVTTRPVQGAAPELRFINPPNPVTVNDRLFSVRVQTTNVAAWQDVEVKVNGMPNTNFSFGRDGLVNLNIGLNEGQNRVEVYGKNESGQQSASTVITYNRAAAVNPVTTSVTNPVTTTVTNPVTTTVTNPVTTTVTNPVTTTVTNPVTTSVTNPVTTTVTNPVTTTVTNPVTTTVTNPVTTTVTNPVTTTVTNPVTTTVTNPVTTTVTNPVTTTVTNPVTTTVTNPVVDKPCGVRINPGNSDWQFCLVTPRGTFNRDNLSNSSFSYSGQASSLYIMPIAGGGDAMVNGKPYKLKSGQYYLFTGNLTVSVSTNNPGSMGQWSVCITSNRAPATGNGNNRPASPCENGSKK